MFELLILFICSLFVISIAKNINKKQANILLIVADDLGYNDLSSFGSPTISTPNIDRIGTRGVRFTQFYQGAPLCTPARASMLTGRLPIRSGIYTDLQPPVDELFRVFYPTSAGCLPQSEITIAEALKPSYSTMMIGKWHLGHNKENSCLPGNGNHGFDFFYGIPYSHEEGYPGPFPESIVFPPVPVITNGFKFIEQPFNASDLTSRYTSITQELIERFGYGQNNILNNDIEVNNLFDDSLDYSKPFFLHIGYENPHVPLFIGDDYDSSSRRGLYGDVVQEMDLSIGKIIDSLEKASIADNTLIVFTSDNGAWINPSNGLSDRPTKSVGLFDGGSNAPFYEGKGSTWEGGFRVPLLMSYPDEIPPNQIIRAPVTAMDFFPTFIEFAANLELPKDRILDGVNLENLMVLFIINFVFFFYQLILINSFFILIKLG
jgi:arylsulfatase A-like enzyme